MPNEATSACDGDFSFISHGNPPVKLVTIKFQDVVFLSNAINLRSLPCADAARQMRNAARIAGCRAAAGTKVEETMASPAGIAAIIDEVPPAAGTATPVRTAASREAPAAGFPRENRMQRRLPRGPCRQAAGRVPPSIVLA